MSAAMVFRLLEGVLLANHSWVPMLVVSERFSAAHGRKPLGWTSSDMGRDQRRLRRTAAAAGSPNPPAAPAGPLGGYMAVLPKVLFVA